MCPMVTGPRPISWGNRTKRGRSEGLPRRIVGRGDVGQSGVVDGRRRWTAAEMMVDGPTAGGDGSRQDCGAGGEPENARVSFGRVGDVGAEARVVICRRDVGGNERLFVEPELAGDGADKSTIEHAAWKPSPVLVFERFEGACVDPGSVRERFEGNTPRFALAPEAGTE